MTATKRNQITPAEMRALRMFRSIPEASRPQFFQLMATVCEACGWSATDRQSLRVIQIGGK